MSEKKKLKILACPANEGGCAYYRIILPMNKLAEHCSDDVEVRFDMNPLGWDKDEIEKQRRSGIVQKDWTPSNIEWADVVFHQNIHNFGGPYTYELLRLAGEMGKLTHYDNDDLLTELYTGHRLYSVYADNKLSDLTKAIYQMVDLVTVTQRKFAERISQYVGRALVIIKNSIDYNLPCWNLEKLPPPRKKITRVGWVGGIHHEEDVKEFPFVASKVNTKVGPENVYWGWYGRPPVPLDSDGNPEPDWQQEVWINYTKLLTKGMRHKNFSVYPALPGDQYGSMYTNIDVAIAPLQFNAFNDSKSEIKVAECGRYGIPLVATDCGCYDESIINGETGFLIPPDNNPTDWSNALTKLIKDKKRRIEMGKNLKEITDKHFDINKNVHGRLELYQDLIKTKESLKEDPRIN